MGPALVDGKGIDECKMHCFVLQYVYQVKMLLELALIKCSLLYIDLIKNSIKKSLASMGVLLEKCGLKSGGS